MEKSLYQDRVKGELIPEEIKTTPPKKGDQPIPGWLGEKKKLRRRETVQAIAEKIKTIGHYSRLLYLLAIPALRRNKKFLAFLDWHDVHFIRGKEQAILNSQWECVQGKRKFSLIFHRMKTADYRLLESETGVTSRLARRYIQLAVSIGIWQKLGNFSQRGWGIVYTSGYFVKFKDPKTKREGYKKIRWLKKSEKEKIHALQNFHVRY